VAAAIEEGGHPQFQIVVADLPKELGLQIIEGVAHDPDPADAAGHHDLDPARHALSHGWRRRRGFGRPRAFQNFRDLGLVGKPRRWPSGFLRHDERALPGSSSIPKTSFTRVSTSLGIFITPFRAKGFHNRAANSRRSARVAPSRPTCQETGYVAAAAALEPVR
jgi:hypothetical protein